MTELPASLNILGHDYSVTLRENMARDSDRMGQCSSNRLAIEIDPSLPAQNQESVLIHEILEAIDFLLELDLPHVMISQIGTALYQVLKDNNLQFNRKKGGK